MAIHTPDGDVYGAFDHGEGVVTLRPEDIQPITSINTARGTVMLAVVKGRPWRSTERHVTKAERRAIVNGSIGTLYGFSVYESTAEEAHVRAEGRKLVRAIRQMANKRKRAARARTGRR
jgi:hypothetical protein